MGCLGELSLTKGGPAAPCAAVGVIAGVRAQGRAVGVQLALQGERGGEIEVLSAPPLPTCPLQFPCPHSCGEAGAHLDDADGFSGEVVAGVGEEGQYQSQPPIAVGGRKKRVQGLWDRDGWPQHPTGLFCWIGDLN